MRSLSRTKVVRERLSIFSFLPPNLVPHHWVGDAPRPVSVYHQWADDLITVLATDEDVSGHPRLTRLTYPPDPVG